MNDATESVISNTDGASSGNGEYRVLARTTRPQSFNDLIGQDAMVRTLTNAFDSGRIAHAFILTGVRGVGKTTTARIIARAFNCIGPDGNGGPTITPCGVCEFCTSIAEDRMVDVMEMDAASRTGVDDIRELIEGVRYRPVSARYKVYIIDEVHMLSRNAFNALLKTLEEPPDHVKFIFATTEIRKVPVTVLSRCQRFDLRRVDVETLTRHFAAIAEKENANINDAAIALIARTADGSVRDGLSLLDQAVAVGAGSGAAMGDEEVRAMLGLANREGSFDLFEKTMAGDVAGALELLDRDYTDGADPLVVLQDLLEVVHWLTRIKVSPAVLTEPGTAEIDRVRGGALSDTLSMSVLTRAWQMLLKGVREVQSAPAPIQAAEMILIRLAYMVDLPTPADAVRNLESERNTGKTASASAPTPDPTAGPAPVANSEPAQTLQTNAAATQSATVLAIQPSEAVLEAPAQPVTAALPKPQSFEEVIALTDRFNERILKDELVGDVHLVGFRPGAIEFRLRAGAERDFTSRLSKFLSEKTGERWIFTLAREGGDATVREREQADAKGKLDEVSGHPTVQSIMEIFPGAEIENIRTINSAPDISTPEAEENGDEDV
ncbi:MAG: DNA polymerase III subunit gamma/tau [Rhodospirillales bacterium]|nr:DNA polymerase III subunit gamma/tau [Rhodospirillales bacterium]